MKNWILILASLGLIHCAQQEENDAVSADTAVIESASSALSSMGDDQSGESLAMKADTNLMDLLFPKAYASTCQRPYFSTCQSGVKSETYENCPLYRGVLDGEAFLTYSDPSCALSTNGQSVTRTYDLRVTGPRGGVFNLSSETATDYNGNSYGGGGQLTKTAAGWDVNILGKHKSFINRRGNLAYSVSIRTLQPVEISGSLSRNGRVANNGQIEVNHNLAQFTAVMSANNIQWSSSCCHPVSGSMTITYSGSKTGTSTVEFQGCGSAELNRDGQTENIELSYCE